jgi:hypothetical protein
MGVHSASKRGLIGLIWQILLFVVSSFMLFGVFPYQLYNRNFMLSHIIVAIFWLLVWLYAYKKLFPKKDGPTLAQPEILPSCDSPSHSAAELKTMEISQPSASKRGLIGFIWHKLLFVVSTFMLSGVFPYQLYNRNLKLSYILVAIFCLLVWLYAYKKLFSKKDGLTMPQSEISQPSASKRGLKSLIWQIVQFAVSCFMLFRVSFSLYQNFKLVLLIVVIFWLLMCHATYKKLFPKKDVPTIAQPEISPSRVPTSSHSSAELKTMEIAQPDDKEEIKQAYIPPRVFDTLEKPIQSEGDKVNIYCSKCGKENAEISNFCSSCGNQLSERND